MCEDEKKRVINELINFYTVFQKEVLDMFPEDISGISPLLFRALREIYFAEGLISSVLAKRLAITAPNTSRCLQHLDDLGYIVRVKDKYDRRITHIKLTKKGSELVEESIKSMDELVLKKLSVLELEELVQLSEAFSVVNEMFNKIAVLSH